MFSDEILLSLTRKVRIVPMFWPLIPRACSIMLQTANPNAYHKKHPCFSNFSFLSEPSLITDFRCPGILNLLFKVRLPDVEFYINVGDWPLETRRADASPGPVPVFSWCGSTETRDIVLPTYEVTHSTLETLRGVTNDLLSVQGNTGNTHTHTPEPL